MPIAVRSWIRRMRGGAQCHLVEAANGHYYVLKPRNNPQHRRVLINEWVASTFLRHLRIPCPDVAVLTLDADLVAAHPEFCIQRGLRSDPVAAGWHFGSRYPGRPGEVAIYDFVPDIVLAEVANLREFTGALVFDQWMSNMDARQAIFQRAHVRVAGEEPVGKAGYAASMIDHGFVLQGQHWNLTDSTRQGIYHRPSVYRQVRGWNDFEPWLSQVRHFPEEVVDQAVRTLPADWMEDDHETLIALLERLMRRRRRVPDLIENLRDDKSQALFPSWRK